MAINIKPKSAAWRLNFRMRLIPVKLVQPAKSDINLPDAPTLVSAALNSTGMV
jgi:hypothetical protein